jgi:hypothetical protein
MLSSVPSTPSGREKGGLGKEDEILIPDRNRIMGPVPTYKVKQAQKQKTADRRLQTENSRQQIVYHI